MANAIILHRRRGEIIEPGSQTFTANGVFVVPYSTTYTIIIQPYVPTGGNGGNGSSGRVTSDPVWLNGGNGGGGGGGVSSNYTVNCNIYIKKGTVVDVTVQTALISFSNKVSVSNGASPKRGLDASSNSYGSGGAGEEKHTVIAPNGWSFTGQDGGSSGQDGYTGMSIQPAIVSTAHGGIGGNAGSVGGGAGGTGGTVHFDYGHIIYDQPTNGTTGSPAVTGSITVSWGGNT